MEHCYVFRYGVSAEGPHQEIPDDTLERIEDAFLDAVVAEGVYAGGGVREYTRLDLLLDRLWIFLWRFKWLREVI